MSKEKFVADFIIAMIRSLLAGGPIHWIHRSSKSLYGKKYDISSETKRRALHKLVECGYLRHTPGNHNYEIGAELVEQLYDFLSDERKEQAEAFYKWLEGDRSNETHKVLSPHPY